MLTDMIVEEEFEIKEEEPWYDKQDLEHGTVSSLPLFVCAASEIKDTAGLHRTIGYSIMRRIRN